ncbi:gamma-glutamyltransferase family protein [Rhodohalobacter sp. SW132]|uniref:gamma-glutamyltransferase family protein n=1 Tax=Rhodohalobacter sp. SW132 TaxID=2293433 RepID=UPI000E280FC8|nr:gamma-glutamyltransferase family protein [Rhodohalobacter sp. SW132]REL37645.1 gamma-glutamyltransferase family protein [Rhodohalobacter sp. SW132]
MLSNRITGVLSLLLFFVFIGTGCDGDQPEQDVQYVIPQQPELATGYTEKPGWATSEFAVAAANPLATDAGYQILQAGGSAVDAAIAVQMVLTLVEPQSSGIGGGAFLITFDDGNTRAYNGRETAPSGAGPDLFLDETGEPLPYRESVRSGLSVGVPGTIAMLAEAHQQHGRLDWEELFTPAITLAEEGFNISPRLFGLLEADETLREDSIAAELYYDENGDPHPVGYNLQNPALAEILRNVASEGTPAFYNETVAESMVEQIRSHERPGTMTVEDVLRYPDRNFEVDAMCNEWKAYRLCGMPPPSSGHIAVMQMLGILEVIENREPFEAFRDSLPTAEWMHLYLEAAKLAFADRALYIGDAEFVEAPAGDWQSLLNTNYLTERSELIGETSMGEAEPGDPSESTTMFGIQPEQPEMGTSHISIVDRFGQAVSMTTTIENGFGSRIMSDGGTGLPGGFHLNNELTDFSRAPYDEQGRPMANRVEADKQPRSSMTPTLIFDADTGDFVASVGSPGGAAIIHYTAKAIIGMLDWNLNAQDAINLPNFANFNGPSVLEQDRWPESLISTLEELGHEISTRDQTSGIQAIQKTEDGFFGGADPRREGVVMGN